MLRETPAAEPAAPVAEEEKPKKRGRKTKAEKEGRKHVTRAAGEAATAEPVANEDNNVNTEDFVVPEAAEFSVGASDEEEANTPNAIEHQVRKNGCQQSSCTRIRTFRRFLR